MNIPNEASYIRDSSDGHMLIDYNGRVRKMARHNYIKPLLMT